MTLLTHPQLYQNSILDINAQETHIQMKGARKFDYYKFYILHAHIFCNDAAR